MTRTVAIVGGGYGGTLVARALDDEADVVLIDPRDAFVNVAGQLRALTRPRWAPHTFFPYRTLLERGRVVRDAAASVDAAGVVLAGGGRVDADYLVLATGSSYAFPARPRQASTAAALDELAATHRQLARAGRVLILGAGPVGLELAGEIREVWPDKRISVVDRSDTLLPRLLPEVRDDLRRQLKELDIDVQLSTSLRGLPPTESGTAGTFTVTTHPGTEITADIWFRSFGSRVNTDYLADGRLVGLADDGTVPVDDHLRVCGHANVYALGDIAHLAEAKMATHAQTQALTVVDNLRAQLRGMPPEAVHDVAPVPRILLPLGSRGGVGQLPAPDGTAVAAPRETVIRRKGLDLFTARFAERFRAAGAPRPTA
ncbi:FAD-dependent oxidoreductase [Isoptericola sp. F-RaC21]|uniref:NAD(P)/FAD-dependent oxidoreductase n=1 Tax=Isoptericola sp. F-RaC21 TaxID=3141452 RepID=UPI00315BB672